MQQRISGNCILPMALWGSQPPNHDVTCLLVTPDNNYLLTGDNEGKIIVWHLKIGTKNEIQIYSKWMLLCHKNPLIELVLVGGGKDGLRPYVVAVTDSGEMSLWDIDEGRCLECRRDSHHLHTRVIPHESVGKIYSRLYACGRYPEITIYDGFHLELLYTLSSPINSDWFIAFTIFTHTDQYNDVVLALSISNSVCLWTLSDKDKLHEAKPAEESKSLNCNDVLSLSCCPTRQRTVLIVCRYSWRIYDAADWSNIMTHKCLHSEPFTGGTFVSSDCILLYTTTGRAILYKLPAGFASPTSLFRRDSSSNSGVTPTAIFELPPSWKESPFCLKFRSKRFYWFDNSTSLPQLIAANGFGDLLFYSPFNPEKSVSGSQFPIFIHSLKDYWSKERPNNLLTCFQKSNSSATATPASEDNKMPMLTASCLINHSGQICLGLDSGEIIIAPIMDTLVRLFFTDCTEPPVHLRLIGHTAPVTCLLHPNSSNLGGHVPGNSNHPSASFHSDSPDSSSFQPSLSTAGGGQTISSYPPSLGSAAKPLYDPDLLLSGSRDFSVRLWHITTATQLAIFHTHAGPVIGIYTVPMRAGTANRATGCVVSLGEDYSLSLISLREKKAVLHCAHQTSTILSLGWRALDDFLLISCLDGTVYVWEIGSGYLDRQETGQQAQDIFENCPIYTRIHNHRGQLLLPQMKQARENHRENRHRSLFLPSISLLCTAFAKPHLPQQQQSASATTKTKSHSKPRQQQPPQQDNSLFPTHQMLCFDLESIIVDLMGEDARQHQPLHDRSNTPFASSVQLSQLGVVGNSPAAINPPSKRFVSSANLGSLTFKKENYDPNMVSNGKPIDANEQGIEQCSLEKKLVFLLISLLHPWGLDPGIDRAFQKTLGIVLPSYLKEVNVVREYSNIVRPYWGQLSKRNALALLMPGWTHSCPRQGISAMDSDWNVSRSLSSLRLMCLSGLNEAMIALPDDSLATWEVTCLSQLMNSEDDGGNNIRGGGNKTENAINGGNWKPPHSTRPRNLSSSYGSTSGVDKHQVCRLASTIISSTLLEYLEQKSLHNPLLQLFLMKWQNRCIQIRNACQTSCYAILDRFNASDRNYLVQRWSHYLPAFATTEISTSNGPSGGGGASASAAGGNEFSELSPRDATDQLTLSVYNVNDDCGSLLLELDWWLTSSTHKMPPRELQKLQSLSIILLGAMGARYGGTTTSSSNLSRQQSLGGNQSAATESQQQLLIDFSDDNYSSTVAQPTNKCQSLDGFALDNYHLARCTCRALTLLANRQIGDTSNSSLGHAAIPPPASMSAAMNHSLTVSSLHSHHHSAHYSTTTNSTSTSSTSSSSSSVLFTHHTGGGAGGGTASLAQVGASLHSGSPGAILWYGTMRRIAMDLLGKGFSVWEPYLDVGQLLNTLLFSAKDAEFLINSFESGTTIPDHIDSARVARQSLQSIAQSKPKVFIVTLSREVVRYNSSGGSSTANNQLLSTSSSSSVTGLMASGMPMLIPNTNLNAQTTPGGLAASSASFLSGSQPPIFLSRGEIWRCIETLFNLPSHDVLEVLAEVVDILLFCVDKVRLREQGLPELCPFLKSFYMIACNVRSQKVMVGSRNGSVAFYDFKIGKYNVSPGHKHAITAVAFSPDGKYSASYCLQDNQVRVWQLTSSGLFGVGGHSVKAYTIQSFPPIGGASNANFSASTVLKIEWPDAKTIQLMSTSNNGVLGRIKL